MNLSTWMLLLILLIGGLKFHSHVAIIIRDANRIMGFVMHSSRVINDIMHSSRVINDTDEILLLNLCNTTLLFNTLCKAIKLRIKHCTQTLFLKPGSIG